MHRLIRDQSGQTMVFGAISLFLLVTFTALVFNVGQVVSHRVEMQNAADAAARSGALAEANLVSTVAFLNDGMAYLYYDLIRYTTNVTVFGVLAELKGAGPPFPTDAVVGVTDPVGHYNQAFLEADTQVPRILGWLDIVGRVERAITLSGAELVKREIHRSAVVNAEHDVKGVAKGVESLAIFPDFSFRPHLGGYLRLDIDQIMPNDGWHIVSNTGYMIEIRRLGPGHWLITSTAGVQIEIERIGPNHYILKSGAQTLDIDRPTADHVIATVTGPNPTTIDCRLLPGIGWAIDAVSPTVRVEYQPFRDGGFMVTCTPGGSVGVRRGQSGRLEMWDGTQWVDVPGWQNSIQVGGKTIPVQVSNQIALPGNATLDLPNSIRIGAISFTIPDSVNIGSTGIQLRPTSVRISAVVGPASFVIDDMGAQPQLEVNGLGLADADGRWRILSERATRHRLQKPYAAQNYWIYEYVSNASYLFEDGTQRLARHATYDNDPYALAHNNAAPAWTEWFNAETGALVTPTAYSQSRPSWDPSLTNYTDSQGRPFVRRVASDAFHRNNRQYMSIDLNAIPRPLRLTDDFLIFGINVAVWRDKDAPMLEGGQQGALRFEVFDNPAWGYFAIASARCAFLDNTQSPHQWHATFDTAGEITDWVQTSYQNLYEPVWTGLMVSTRESVKSEHIDCIAPDTGTNFVWRGLAGGSYTWLGHTYGGATWHDPDPPDEYRQFRQPMNAIPEKFRSMTNRWNGNAFDHISPDLPGAIDH